MTDIRAALRLHGGSEAKCCKRTILTTFHLIQMQQRGNVLRFLHDKQIDARKALGRFFLCKIQVAVAGNPKLLICFRVG